MQLKEENVWDYPRPAICERFTGILKVVVGERTIAQTQSGYRTLETSHPPTYYFPPQDVDQEFLEKNRHITHCEWKGKAQYFDYKYDRNLIENIAWTYTHPTEHFQSISNFISFYASKAQACFVNDEQVIAQEGDFYGGWITRNLTGPFKGAVGTLGW